MTCFVSNDEYVTIHLQYDYTLDRLSVRWASAAADLFDIDIRRLKYPVPMTPNLVYRFTGNADEVVVYNAATGTVNLHRIRLQGSSSNEVLEELGETNVTGASQRSRTFGDGEVLGLANASGIHLWSFNPKFAFPSRMDSILWRRQIDEFCP